MKNFLKPSSIVFYFLSVILVFLIMMVISAVTGAAKGQGLAGPAIILGNGLIGGFIAFVIAITVVNFLNEKVVVLLNKIFGAVFLLLVALFVYRFITRDQPNDEPENPERKLKQKTTEPLPVMGGLNSAPVLKSEYKPPMGLGMVKPNFYNNRVLYLYGDPNLEKPVNDHTPTDSVVFKQTETGFEISYAPPWFFPTHNKMDYEILLLRAVSITPEFTEVMVNETNGQTSYIERHKNKVLYWPEFLFTINSVEIISPGENPIRVKPLSHAGLVTAQYSYLRVLKIKNQWMQVELIDEHYKLLTRGWSKWQENGKLLIIYYLLS